MIESSILIVSDEPTTSRIWALCVTELHCIPLVGDSVPSALAVLEQAAPDLIVVDVTSREVSAVQVCAALREHTSAPLLVLTPINNESHSLEVYQAGADDCIIKPISPALFLAKTKVWLHRSWTVQVESLDQLAIGDLSLEPSKHRLVNREGKVTHLSNLEFRVLHLLMNHPNEKYTSEEILERAWGVHSYSGGSSVLVKNVIYRLRKKIEPNPNQLHYIQTVTGGYLFRK